MGTMIRQPSSVIVAGPSGSGKERIGGTMVKVSELVSSQNRSVCV